MKQKAFPLSQVAEIQLSYNPKVKAVDRPKISGVDDMYKILLDNWDLELIQLQEQFKIVLLNRANRIIGICEISKGGFSETSVDAKVVFSIALKGCASAIILVHNHPSGSLKVSKSDMLLTRKLIEGGKLLDIVVHDHFIITAEGFLSMAREELI